MNKIFKLSLLGIITVVALAGCVADRCVSEITYLKYTPVYMDLDEFRSSIKNESPRALVNPGKFFFKGNYIFVSETDEGIHVIDNNNPSAPQNIAFIRVPGNNDISIQGNILFADSYMDLVAIDISNPQSVELTGRVENSFEYVNWKYGVALEDPASHGVVKEWKTELVTEKIKGDCGSGGNGSGRNGGGFGLMDQVNTAGGGAMAEADASGKANNSSEGKAGSMSRFAFHGGYLYALDQGSLKVFNISILAHPELSSSIDNSMWGAETLFPYEDHLYVGTQSGLLIYGLSNPASPNRVSEYWHVTSCDPVVVEDGLAYVTLRNGRKCEGYTNQLEIIDVSSPANPQLLATHSMYNPHGLGIDNKTLFVCDGDEGLKIYDVTNSNDIDILKKYKDMNTFDVIPLSSSKTLLMIGEDGLYQYDYSDLDNIKELSFLPIEREERPF